MVYSLRAHGREQLRKSKDLRIGFIGFDGVRALDLTGPLEVFAAAESLNSRSKAERNYQLTIVSLTRKSFISQSGVTFKAQETLSSATAFDTIILPGGDGLQRNQASIEVSRWLAARASGIRRIAAVCGGIYPLAQSGLLNGRQATTHWRLVADVAQRFPQVTLKPDASFLKDGCFHTCGGGAAAMEMCLSLINEDYGHQLALPLARELVVRLRPPGDTDAAEPACFQSDALERLAELPGWIVAHIDDDLSVETLARRACLCPRHFSRVFKSTFKRTPADFVEALRLQEARRRLQTSRHSVESIAAAVGYTSSDAFRRAFERRLGITPSSFRRSTRAQNASPTFVTDRFPASHRHSLA